MGFKDVAICASALLAATGSATPVFHHPRGANTTYAYTNSNGLRFTHFNQFLPNVTVLATGTPPCRLQSSQ